MKQILAALAVLAVLIAIVVFVALRPDEGADEAAAIAEGTSVGTSATDDTADGATTEEAAVDAAQTTIGDSAAVDGDATGSDETTVAAAETGGTTADLGAAAGQEEGTALRPSFDVVRVETSGEAVLAGRAAPGATVHVMTGDGVLAETTADENGEWVIVLETPFAAGNHEIWLQATTPDGSVSESGEAVIVSVPDAATLQAQADSGDGSSDGTGGALAVTVQRDGGGEVAVLQAPAAGVGLSGGGALTLDSLSYDENGTVTLAGKAEPGSEVRPYVDGELAGTTTADADGNWSLSLERRIDDGLHALRVDQVDSQGTVAARLETPFQQAAFTLPSTAEPLIVIQPGNNLWVIARHVYGKGVLFTEIFEANRDQIADPDLIYPGQIFMLPNAAGGA